MVFEVRVYKPDKDGNLILDKTVQKEDLSKIHWTKFNKDNKYQIDFSDTPKFHRIGNDQKQCVEDGCTVMVEDPRSLTCSYKCKITRLRRKNKEARARQRAKQYERSKKNK